MHTHVYIFTCMCTYIYTGVHTLTCAHTYTHTHTCKHTLVHTCACAHTDIHMCTHTIYQFWYFYKLVNFFFIMCHLKVYRSCAHVQERLLPLCNTLLTEDHAPHPGDSCWGDRLECWLVELLINRRELMPHHLPSEMLAAPVRLL